MNFTTVTFNVRIDRTSYPDLLSHMREFTATGEVVAGMPGQVYQPAPALLIHQFVTSDTQLVLGSLILNGDFSHLPSGAATALAQVSPHFTRPVMFDALQRALVDPSMNLQTLKRGLELAARTSCELVATSPAPAGSRICYRWQPQGTRVVFNKGHWFACLQFDAQFHTSTPPGTRRVGLDLGWAPMTVAVTDHDEVQEFHGAALIHARALFEPGTLSAPALHLLARLEYAVGRADCERLLDYLFDNASAVHAERLKQNSGNGMFVSLSRKRATYDYHNAWLHELLRVAQILLCRVPAAFTSQQCSRCGERGIRNGKYFRCLACGHAEHADHNAARNVLKAG